MFQVRVSISSQYKCVILTRIQVFPSEKRMRLPTRLKRKRRSPNVTGYIPSTVLLLDSWLIQLLEMLF